MVSSSSTNTHNTVNSIHENEPNPQGRPNKKIFLLAIGALGVVFGDIGTSPLYTIKVCFYGIHAILPTNDNILGVLSLIFWSLTIVVSSHVHTPS